MSKRARILVIDDDPLLRGVIVSLLRKDYYTSLASSGAEGFYTALEQPPDIVVLDVNMPGWNGLHTLNAFRSHSTLRGVRVIMLTSDASKDTVLAAINSGANDYVIKTSFSKEEFLNKIENLLPPDSAETEARRSRQPTTVAAGSSTGSQAASSTKRGSDSFTRSAATLQKAQTGQRALVHSCPNDSPFADEKPIHELIDARD